jgi:hypothetical protein
MAEEIKKPLKDLGLRNTWTRVPPLVAKCQHDGHNIVEILMGRGFHEMQCHECGYAFQHNFEEKVQNPDVMKNPMADLLDALKSPAKDAGMTEGMLLALAPLLAKLVDEGVKKAMDEQRAVLESSKVPDKAVK